MSFVSESTQWWQNMAIVVIFGLMLATFLTLIVVPTFYSLLASANEGFQRLLDKIKRDYWQPTEDHPQV
jgi:predicted RND superfamily exporter protein